MLGFKLGGASLEITGPAGGRGIPSVGKSVDQNVSNAGRPSRLGQSNRMPVVTVNAPVRNKPKQMQPAVARPGKRFLQDLVPAELTFGNGFVDPGQILINNPPGPKVKVAHLGISHLALRQSDIETAGAEFSARIIPIKLVVKRRPCQQSGVSILFSLGGPAWIDAPTVANDQHDRPGHVGHFADDSKSGQAVLSLTTKKPSHQIA